MEQRLFFKTVTMKIASSRRYLKRAIRVNKILLNFFWVSIISKISKNNTKIFCFFKFQNICNLLKNVLLNLFLFFCYLNFKKFCFLKTQIFYQNSKKKNIKVNWPFLFENTNKNKQITTLCKNSFLTNNKNNNKKFAALNNNNNKQKKW